MFTVVFKIFLVLLQNFDLDFGGMESDGSEICDISQRFPNGSMWSSIGLSKKYACHIWWKNYPGQKQTIRFINGRSPKFTKDLLNLSRNTVRITVDLLIGHCRLKRNHMQVLLKKRINR